MTRDHFQASSLLILHDRTFGHRERRIVNGRILLVEADFVLGAVLAEVLRHSGYEVIFVRTLQGKVERFDSLSTVILDIDTTAPEKELVWLGVLQPYDESMAIVLMGLEVPQELRHRLRLHLGRQQTNALTMVQKPFRNEELLAAVRQAQESSLSGQAKGR
jgi:CheY-like chemotaxis protein